MLYHALQMFPTAFFRKGKPCGFAILENGYDAVFPENFRQGAEHINIKDRTACLLFPDAELNHHLQQLLLAKNIPQNLGECFERGLYEGRAGFLNYLQVESALKSVGIQRMGMMMVGSIPLMQGTFVAARASYFGERETVYRRMDDLIGTNPRVRKEKYQAMILLAVRNLDKAFLPGSGGPERAGFFQLHKDSILQAAATTLAHPDFDRTTSFEKRVAQKLASTEWPTMTDFENAVQSAVFPAWKKKLDQQQKKLADGIAQHLLRCASSRETAEVLVKLAFGGEDREQMIARVMGAK